jgi:hypothetical protein
MADMCLLVVDFFPYACDGDGQFIDLDQRKWVTPEALNVAHARIRIG